MCFPRPALESVLLPEHHRQRGASSLQSRKKKSFSSLVSFRFTHRKKHESQLEQERRLAVTLTDLSRLFISPKEIGGRYEKKGIDHEVNPKDKRRAGNQQIDQ
jgi:hypothetical protein